MPCILRDLMFHKPCALCSPFFTCFVPFVMPCLTFLIQNMLFLLWAWLVSYVLYILRVLLDLIPYIPQVLCALLSYEPCRLLCFSRSLFKMLCALCNLVSHVPCVWQTLLPHALSWLMCPLCFVSFWLHVPIPSFVILFPNALCASFPIWFLLKSFCGGIY